MPRDENGNWYLTVPDYDLWTIVNQPSATVQIPNDVYRQINLADDDFRINPPPLKQITRKPEEIFFREESSLENDIDDYCNIYMVEGNHTRAKIFCDFMDYDTMLITRYEHMSDFTIENRRVEEVLEALIERLRELEWMENLVYRRFNEDGSEHNSMEILERLGFIIMHEGRDSKWMLLNLR